MMPCKPLLLKILTPLTPTPEQAQKRIDEMFISNYGLDVGIYKIEASLVSWGTSIIT